LIAITLAPRTYGKIGITDSLVRFIAGDKIVDSLDIVKDVIQELLEESLKITIEETKAWIVKKVPKRSGDLRNSLIKYLERSIPPAAVDRGAEGIRLVLGVGADIPYAEAVNEMTTKQVRHSGSWREHSVAYVTKGRGKDKKGAGRKYFPFAYSKGHRTYLYDPQAIGGYHDEMVAFATTRFKINIYKASYKFSRGA